MKRDCVEIADKLYAFLDGELGELDSRAAKRHLAGCSSCSSLLEEERNFDAALRDEMKITGAPAGLAEKISLALAREEMKQAGTRRWLPRAAAAGISLAAAVFFLAIPFFRGGGDGFAGVLSEASVLHRGLVRGEALDVPVPGDLLAAMERIGTRIDFDTVFPDLSSAGFSLAAAGISVLRGGSAACLFFKKGNSRVSAFSVDLAGVKLPEAAVEKPDGSYLCSGEAAGGAWVLYGRGKSGPWCLLVSDMPEESLAKIAESALSRY